MKFADKLHGSWLGPRRVGALVHHLARLLPEQGSLLDVGCGDGALTEQLGRQKPGLEISGIDVAKRPGARVPIGLFDGERIPHDDQTFDHVLLVDVLHHCDPPETLLAEALRVTRGHLLIKDHRLEGWLAGPTLRAMDRVGNARHGVPLPYSYWSEARWRETWQKLGLTVDSFEVDLRLYPPPLGLAFDRGLHFIASLSRA